MKNFFAKIKAISSYLPEIVEKNSDIDADKRLNKKIGVLQRHVSSKAESAGDLAFKAAEKLFSEYDIDRNEIDFILLCVQHPDYQMPHTSAHLQHRLGLSKNVGTMDISHGCAGYIYGLATAKGFIEAGMCKKILFLTSSVYLKYINVKDKANRPLFGDGATATLIEGVESDQESLSAFVFGSDGEKFDKLIIPVGGSRFMPRDTEEIFKTDENKNYYSNYEVYMDGMAIAYFTLREVPTLIENVLSKAELKREDLDYCIFHQANKFMLEHLRIKAELENVPYYNEITDTGNLVSGSVPYAIEQVVNSVDVKNLKKVLLTGFGVGLSWAGCIADLSEILSKKGENDG